MPCLEVSLSDDVSGPYRTGQYSTIIRPDLKQSLMWTRSCLVHVRRLLRPLWSMHFSDVRFLPTISPSHESLFPGSRFCVFSPYLSSRQPEQSGHKITVTWRRIGDFNLWQVPFTNSSFQLLHGFGGGLGPTQSRLAGSWVRNRFFLFKDSFIREHLLVALFTFV